MQAASTPAAGDKLPLDDLKGALLYFTVKAKQRNIETQFGPADAVAADVAVLDGSHKGETFEDTLVFPRYLQRQLEAGLEGDPVVVGRLGRGEAKPGKSAPWELNPPTADDLAVATKYEAYAAQKAAEQESPF